MTHTIQTFRRLSAALTAAQGRGYLRLGNGSETIYVVGLDDGIDSIELISPPIAPVGSQTRSTRQIIGQVTIRHLARLGNANHARNVAEVKAELAAERAAYLAPAEEA